MPNVMSPAIAAGLALVMQLALPAHGAAWGVGPLRVDLDRGSKSGIVNISNDDTLRLNFEIRLMRWTQDAAGADRYEPSDDLVYFPRAATLEPQEKRVVRVGSRGEPPAIERTYRLFIEEMPDPASLNQPGIGVAVKGRFAIPVFVAPAQGEARGELVDATVEKGELRVRLRNSGNRHFKIDTFTLRAADGFAKEGNGWYVLAGATRAFVLPLTAEECRKHPDAEVVLKGETQEFRHAVVLDPARCVK